MVSATCGIPVTVTASLKVTVTEIASPAVKEPLGPVPVPESERPVTVGATASAAFPFTAGPVSVIAVRVRVASLAPASLISPPFSVSAEVPTLSPPVSESPDATV